MTIMLRDQGLDAGPIVAQAAYTRNGKETGGELTSALSSVGASLLIASLLPYCRGDLSPTPQPGTGVLQTKRIQALDTRIDWARPSTFIERMVRAYSPQPGAWTLLEGNRLIVMRASLTTLRSKERPGSLVEAGRHAIGVSCGDGAILSLGLVQRGGKTPLDTEQFYNGYRRFLGSVLGESQSSDPTDHANRDASPSPKIPGIGRA